MGSDVQSIGMRWDGSTFTINYFNRPAFSNNARPTIPNVDFDNFLHYEPTANICTFMRNGTAYVMTDIQKQSCNEYIANLELPGFAYDTLRENIFTGIMFKNKAQTLGYGFTQIAIDNPKQKFNTLSNKWENLFCIIDQNGRPHFDWDTSKLSAMYDEETPVPYLNNAVMFLTEDEWKTLSANRKSEIEVLDFKTNTWFENTHISLLISQAKQQTTFYISQAKLLVSQKLFDIQESVVDIDWDISDFLDIRQNLFKDLLSSDEIITMANTHFDLFKNFKQDLKRFIVILTCAHFEMHEKTTKQDLDKIVERINQTYQEMFSKYDIDMFALNTDDDI